VLADEHGRATTTRTTGVTLYPRGRHAIKRGGMTAEEFDAITVPLVGREIHVPGSTFLADAGDYQLEMHSIDRGGAVSTDRCDVCTPFLTGCLRLQAAALLTVAERHGAKLRFDCAVRAVDIPKAEVTLEFGDERVSADLIVAADGASSVVREAYLRQCFLKAGTGRFTTEGFTHGWKRLFIPCCLDTDKCSEQLRSALGEKAQKLLLRPDALHIWPYQSGVVIASPEATGGGLDAAVILPLRGPGWSFEAVSPPAICRCSWYQIHF